MPIVPPPRRVVTKGLSPLPSSGDGEAKRFFASIRDAVKELQALALGTERDVTKVTSAVSAISYTETDPVFSAHAAADVTPTRLTNWDTAYGWGDHSAGGYLPRDGTLGLTGNWNAGAFTVTVSGTVISGTNGHVGVGGASDPAWPLVLTSLNAKSYWGRQKEGGTLWSRMQTGTWYFGVESAGIFLRRESATATGPTFTSDHQRNTIASPQGSQNGDLTHLQTYRMYASGYKQAARIESYVDGSPSSASTPGGYRIKLTPPGSTSTETVLDLKSNKSATFYGAVTVVGTITVGGAYTLPGVDGAAHQRLLTDGSGAVSWSDAEPLTLRDWIDADSGYIGKYYSSTSACQIKRVTFSGDTKISEYPDGDDSFTFDWALRDTYTYS